MAKSHMRDLFEVRLSLPRVRKQHGVKTPAEVVSESLQLRVALGNAEWEDLRIYMRQQQMKKLMQDMLDAGYLECIKFYSQFWRSDPIPHYINMLDDGVQHSRAYPKATNERTPIDMTTKMTHSQLVQKLMDLDMVSLKGLPTWRDNLIRATVHGVLPEGETAASQVAELAEDLITIKLPDWLDPATPISKWQPPKDAESNTGYVFGRKSKAELAGVRPQLIRLAYVTLYHFTLIDFTVFDGLRTKVEQAAYVKAGTSKTMDSKHLTGDALDLVPIKNGVPVWDWMLIYQVIHAVDQAAEHLGIAKNIRWGGAWDRRLSDFGGSPEAIHQACKDYANRHPGKPFLDGPHIEWVD